MYICININNDLHLQKCKVKATTTLQLGWSQLIIYYHILLRAARIKTVTEVIPGMKNSFGIA